ncbi:MAG: hypothetical protein CLLPBCKN_007202 [Chroococcidiopsis cubana SAG 39.79]|uniref:Uncharacterized protein n=1 Tax=Chroococcidiopsis cubana SAG 39.79 TaxID=388085 RepID=A0AB37URF6_9CYAN|nr:hypothetical protein [Chroococcidiopsis cubana]MDZ4877767.1 hypothetical protein [Chroococcidiopsis cubana SAG 39.79]PSB62048.1 hypothetical protein C7B79_19595 [Chroococcidiopsis cubana CCALA 043]RUT14049.1 hypothetical protein DSM107010_05320 [Chroococcidiopsis cubana SAG 39.79]
MKKVEIPRVQSKFSVRSLVSLAQYVKNAEEELLAATGKASPLYINGVRLTQGADILQGKPYPIVAVTKENLDEAMRFQDNLLLYPAHNEMARALIERMTLEQKTQLLGHYAQTPSAQIPKTVRELADEVKAQLQLQPKQKVQRQQPKRSRDRDLEI